VASLVARGAPQHPSGDAHHHHQHEADEQQAGVSRDEQAGPVRVEHELPDHDVGSEQRPRRKMKLVLM
jgi:hypothetical protein